ncbi:MAG: hypothetical protein GY822_14745 [Deltaproteobacteria bacterium]|nr:hypothetical protein [Deltaproteobacteria bacterium]
MTAALILHCPACGGRFSAPAHFLEKVTSLVFLCGACGTGFSKKEADLGSVERAPTQNVAVDTGARIIVGHPLPSAQRVVCEELRKVGFAPVCVEDGNGVVQACDPVMPERPVAVVLDVGVTGILAFEVISHVRAFPGCEALPIVLLASVYERTRYKRRPNRLYGANAYLELHHVPDQLAKLVTALVEQESIPEARTQTPADRARSAPLRTDANAIDLRALAHRLISDVALYNGDELASGVFEKDALKYVKAPIAEAKDRYEKLAGAQVGVGEFEAALNAFVERLFSRNVAHEVADAAQVAQESAKT